MPGERKHEILAKRKAGRPREYDAEKIAAELLAWAELEDSITIAAFCADRGYQATLIWRLEKESEDFSDAYQLTKMRLAERRERYLNCNQMNYGSWARYVKSYDPFLSRDEDIEKDKDAARQKGVADKEAANLVTLARMAAEGVIKQPD